MEEEEDEGDLPAREYDYLLTMQILSLTEERVVELERLMKEKRAEHDRLEAMHIFDLWRGDLDKFRIELEKYEVQEEKDRLAHTAEQKKGQKGAAKKIGKRPPAAKRAVKDDESFELKPKKGG